MTEQEFKETYPEMAHLEGNELWDAMTIGFIRQQQGEEILKAILPFWKRYQLRWLFYRKFSNNIFRPEWQHVEVCKSCNRGADTMMIFGRHVFCVKCGSELIKVPNRRLKYRLWVLWKKADKHIEFTLDYLHILRKRHEYRYSVFGDERNYCYQTSNLDFSIIKTVHKPRKWFEYLFIKK